MESVAEIHHRQPFLHFSSHRSSFFKPISTISFKSPANSKFTKISLRASSLPPPSTLKPHNKNPPPLETLKPLSSFVKTTCIAVFATALFFARFNKPSFAAPVPSPTVEYKEETTAKDTDDEEKESTIEEYLSSNPEDIQALRDLLEVKINLEKIEEAIPIVDRLIETKPRDKEWRLLKANLLCRYGDVELAKLGFEELIVEDPFLVEAYHGLVKATTQSESGELDEILKRIENAVDKCKKEKRKGDARDFRLLIAQVRVIEGKLTDALKIYQELQEEEPMDFRPYLCQSFVYRLMNEIEEADKQFKKFRRLVPESHHYNRYIVDTVVKPKDYSKGVRSQMVTMRRS